MDHVVLTAVQGRLLFTSWAEACGLWDRLTDVGVAAMTFMPDHVHILHARPSPRTIGDRCSGYARWVNHRRGQSGQLFQPISSVKVPNDQHLRRTIRYMALNPCRAGLVNDPLAWPFSTHRDVVGLAYPGIVAKMGDAAGHHAYVSGDPTVSVAGSGLPYSANPHPTAAFAFEAVSSILRIPEETLRTVPKRRRLAMAVVRQIAVDGERAVLDVFGAGRATLYRLPKPPLRCVHMVERVLGDPRFYGLGAADLRYQREWWRYRRKSPV